MHSPFGLGGVGIGAAGRAEPSTKGFRGVTQVGVDYGRRRTGLAANVNGVVVPLKPLCPSTWEGLVERLRRIAEDHGSGTVVLGLPLSAGGKPTELSREVERLGEYLREKGFQVQLQTEVRSSEEAEELLGGTDRSGRVDSVAACVILKRFLGEP
ncbi:Holliday junction resolvase RuvX [Candidatus Fermentibacteria bacterium]|nr:Holliday junction resolvase RuvX [Candidatus Fermentibacteria bacterium]